MSSETKMKTSHPRMNAVIGKNFDLEQQKAGYKIQAFLALQAWKRQKQENNELKFNIKILSEKVEALQLQKYSLKELLDAEKIRLAIMNNDVHRVLNNLEECKQEKKLLLKERDILQDRIKALDEKYDGLENEYKNQKNELLTIRQEARNWEKQLEKEREKLSKMKSEKKLAIEDAQDLGEDAKDTVGSSNRKVQRETRIKSTACRNPKKNTSRGRDAGP